MEARDTMLALSPLIKYQCYEWVINSVSVTSVNVMLTNVPVCCTAFKEPSYYERYSSCHHALCEKTSLSALCAREAPDGPKGRRQLTLVSGGDLTQNRNAKSSWPSVLSLVQKWGSRQTVAATATKSLSNSKVKHLWDSSFSWKLFSASFVATKWTDLDKGKTSLC